MTTDEIAARLEIADLVHRYALAVRRGDAAAAGALFVDDGVFEVSEAGVLAPQDARVLARSEGRAAIVAYVGRSTASGRTYPALHNLLIEVNGDTARASSLMFATSYPAGHEIMGEYDDRFIRVGGRWQFAERRYTILRAAG